MSDLFEGQHGEPCKHDGAMDLRWVCGLCDKALGYSDDKDRVHANELATLKAKHAALVQAARWLSNAYHNDPPHNDGHDEFVISEEMVRCVSEIVDCYKAITNGQSLGEGGEA